MPCYWIAKVYTPLYRRRNPRTLLLLFGLSFRLRLLLLFADIVSAMPLGIPSHFAFALFGQRVIFGPWAFGCLQPLAALLALSNMQGRRIGPLFFDGERKPKWG